MFFRQFLYELSESICEQDLKDIKFLLLKTLPRKKLEKDMVRDTDTASVLCMWPDCDDWLNYL